MRQEAARREAFEVFLKGEVALVALLGAVALSLTAAQAADKTKIRFTLDWKLQGIHAWYFWAQEKGYFAAENLDVVIDQGTGTVTLNSIQTFQQTP